MKLTEVFEQEQSSNQVGYPASEVIDRIRATDRSILAIYHGLQAIGYEGIVPKAQGQIIEPYGKEISAYLDEMLSGYPRNPRVIAQGLQLLSIGIRWPELRSVLEKHKDSVLWYILSKVKDSIERNTYEGKLVARTIIPYLKDIGIDWPELDAILKSIDAPTRVAEDDEASDISSEVYYMLQRSVERMDIWYVLSRMIEWKLNFKKIPQARELFDTRKDFIVKELLHGVKIGNAGYANRRISSLHDIGVDWPELDIIQKSILADREKRASIAEDSDEPGSQEDFVKHSVPNLLKNNNPGAVLNIIYAHYKSDPRNLEWLRKNITPILLKQYNKKKLLQWVAKSVDDVTMPKILSARNLLKQLGVELPDIKTIIDDNKTHIIKRYLQIIRNYKSVEPVAKDIQHLRELGITWPELDIIEKSQRSDNKLQEETEDEQLAAHKEWQIQRVLDEIDVQLNNGYPSFVNWVYQLKYLNALPRVKPIIEKYKKTVIAYAVKRLNEGKIYNIIELENILAEGGIHLPELDNFIERNKDTLVKTLLMKMKKGQKDTVDSTLQTLKKLNIAWPELAIIQKSINVEKNKSMNENITATGQNYIQILRDMLFAIEDYDEQRATENFLAMARFWMLSQVLEYVWYHVTTREHATWFYNLQKRPIMVYLLEEIKDAPDSGIPEHIVKLLRKAKMDWPEIDIVERSLAADIKSVKETDIASYYDMARDLSHGLQTGNLHAIGVNLQYLMFKYGLDTVLKKYIGKVPTQQLVKILNIIKLPILRYLKSHISNNSRANLVKDIDMLNHLDINWPELNTIQQSVATNK